MTRPSLWWVGRDLRLADNPALSAAAAAGPVIPVAVLDDATVPPGAAAQWRLGRSMHSLDARLRGRGSRLVVRRGDARATLAGLLADTGAQAIHLCDPYPFFAVPQGLPVVLHPPNNLVASGTLATGAGTPYRRFTPFWKSLRAHPIAAPLDASPVPAPADWPAGLDPADWDLGAAMNRGAAVLARHARIGEAAARHRLDAFLAESLSAYGTDRDRPDRPLGTSGLSDALALGEISARSIWHAVLDRGGPGAETFLSELGWRDFARDLMRHSPDMGRQNWNRDWDGFPWQADNPQAEAWRRAETGIDMVDAGMRELYVTGRMHNRVRMIAASFLTKHLLTDWRVGTRWFDDTLIDWDPASNAMNWQWVAGSGPDAAPYFRVFNPDSQGDRFDPSGRYRAHWLTGPGADAFAEAAPRAWRVDPRRRPPPVVTLAAGRQRAVAAYAIARR